MIKNAKFISVWDNGIEVETACKIDTDTKEVFDIEIVEVGGLDTLVYECVTIDGKNHPVLPEDDYEGEGFYYL